MQAIKEETKPDVTVTSFTVIFMMLLWRHYNVTWTVWWRYDNGMVSVYHKTLPESKNNKCFQSKTYLIINTVMVSNQ